MSRIPVKKILTPFPRNVHKHQRGHVLIIAGSRTMSGAALLATAASQRMGAGLVTLAYPRGNRLLYQKVLPEILHKPLPETTAGFVGTGAYNALRPDLDNYDSIVIGPGLGTSRSVASLLRSVLKKTTAPVLLDADAITVFASMPASLRSGSKKKPIIFTPHEGEMARLKGATPEDIRSHREDSVRTFCRKHQAYCVLKGRHTLIGSPEGTVWSNPTGGPGLATAGTGDVLAGILGTLIAQHTDHISSALRVGVYVHGRAGDEATDALGERSVVASDIIGWLPDVLTGLSK